MTLKERMKNNYTVMSENVHKMARKDKRRNGTLIKDD